MNSDGWNRLDFIQIPLFLIGRVLRRPLGRLTLHIDDPVDDRLPIRIDGDLTHFSTLFKGHSTRPFVTNRKRLHFYRKCKNIA